MLAGMRMSIQAELDVFFVHLQDQSQLLLTVSEQAFAQARAKLSLTAIPSLNDWLVARAEPVWFRSALVPLAPGRRRRLDHAFRPAREPRQARRVV